MSKRKLTSEEAVANILRFVEADDDNNYFESDCEDELGLAGDDLDEIYDDDDRGAADEDCGDDDEDEVEEKSSSDDDKPQPQPQLGNRPPQKMLTYNRLVNSIDKSLDPNCFYPHDFATVDDEEHETVLTAYLGPKKILRRKQFYGQTKSWKDSVGKEAATFCRGVLNRQPYYHLHLELKA